MIAAHSMITITLINDRLLIESLKKLRYTESQEKKKNEMIRNTATFATHFRETVSRERENTKELYVMKDMKNQPRKDRKITDANNAVT